MKKQTVCLLTVAVCLSFASAACTRNDGSETTLYRSSPFGVGVRVHWATFDANESDPSYNVSNCRMAARLLNANLTASAQAEGKDRDTAVGFWCEDGPYLEEGPIPASYEEAFPTDV